MYHHYELNELHRRGSQAFQHEIIQTGWNSVRCQIKIVRIFGWKSWECAKENKRCSIQGHDRISHVCNDDHEGKYCICVEYDEPIYIEGCSTSLDGCETHQEGHFGLQIMPWRQEYCFERFLWCKLCGKCKQIRRSTMGYVVFVGIKVFYGYAINN